MDGGRLHQAVVDFKMRRCRNMPIFSGKREHFIIKATVLESGYIYGRRCMSPPFYFRMNFLNGKSAYFYGSKRSIFHSRMMRSITSYALGYE